MSIGTRSRREAESVAAWLVRVDPYLAPQAVVAVALLLDLSLPPKLTLGPSWLLPGVEGLLLVGLVVASPHPRMRHSPARRQLAIGLTAVVSAVNIFSLILLTHLLLHHGTQTVSGDSLIRAGTALWLTNVLLFALWYWQIDRGGPLARRTDPGRQPDFLFPQMTDHKYAPPGWIPGLTDYLYVSLTNATAFSPTDTMPLTPMVKWLMGAQSLVSLVTVGLVVARAVNIL